MGKKLSVIVPVYNKEKYLSRCVESILNQKYKNIELILVNDGSTDSSLSICNGYAKQDERIVVIDKKNGGAASARNKGLDFATGDYIGFCDADDFLDADMYETLIGLIEKNDYPMIDCLSKVFNEQGEIINDCKKSREIRKESVEEAVRALYLRYGNASLCTRVIKSEFIKHIRIPEGRRVEDFYFVLCLLLSVGANYIYEYPFYNFVTTENSVTRTSGGSIYLDAIYFYEKSVELLGTENYKVEQEYYLLKIYYLLFISSTAKERKKYKKLFIEYKKDLKSKKKQIKSNEHLSKKEKNVLRLSCFSVILVRWLYLLKLLVKR